MDTRVHTVRETLQNAGGSPAMGDNWHPASHGGGRGGRKLVLLSFSLLHATETCLTFISVQLGL